MSPLLIAIVALIVAVILATVIPVAVLRRRRLQIGRAQLAMTDRAHEPPSAAACECPVCGALLESFVVADPGRPVRDRCPSCGSRAADRLAWLYLLNETDLFSGGARPRLLHQADGPGVWRGPDRHRHFDYVNRPWADDRESALEPGRFDVIYRDERAAALSGSEAGPGELYRLLRPGGWAIVHPDPDPDPDPDVDLAGLLADSGFQVTIDPYPRRLGSDRTRRFGLRGFAELYFCRRPMGDVGGYVQRLNGEAPDVIENLAAAGASVAVDGRVEEVRDGNVLGWAWSPARPEARLTVRVSVDGRPAAEGIADLQRPSLAQAGVGDGRHMFRIALPQRFAVAGVHRLRVEPEGTVALRAAGRFRTTTPRRSDIWGTASFVVEAHGFGRVETVREGIVSGWVWSPQAPTRPDRVRVVLDGRQVAQGLADRPREGPAGADEGRHGFRIAIPDSPGAGPHSLRVEIDERTEAPSPDAVGVSAGLLAAVTFTAESDVQPPPWQDVAVSVESTVLGRVEAVRGSRVFGWAWDPAQPERRIAVRISVDGRYAGSTVADVEGAWPAGVGMGDGRHDFSFELPAHLAGVGGHGLRVEAEDGIALPGCQSFVLDDESVQTNGDPSPDLVLGRVERIENGVVLGWAAAPRSPDQTVAVRVIVDGEQVATGVADRSRPAPPRPGIGRPHGFRVQLPASAARAGVRQLRVEAADRMPLPAAADFSVVADDPGGCWDGAEFLVEDAVLGRLESLRDGVLTGWAWRPQAPHWRVQVRVLLDGDEVKAGIADLMRPSLRQAGVGDGRHGFRFELPEPSGVGPHRLRVEAEDVPLTPPAGFVVATDRDPTDWRAVELSVDGAARPHGARPVVGHVQQVGDGWVSGWVMSPPTPDWRLWVQATVDDQPVPGCFADLSSAALTQIEGHGGGHGFRLQLPSEARRGAPARLCVEAGAGITLPVAGRSSTVAPGWQVVSSPARYR